MFGLGYQELLIILVIVLILFGANRLPELARSLGSSVKEFKKGVNEAKAEDTRRRREGRREEGVGLPPQSRPADLVRLYTPQSPCGTVPIVGTSPSPRHCPPHRAVAAAVPRAHALQLGRGAVRPGARRVRRRQAPAAPARATSSTSRSARLVNGWLADPTAAYVDARRRLQRTDDLRRLLLARAVYDRPTALAAATLLAVSPLFWFYGSVGLTYAGEALFASIVAYFAFRALNGSEPTPGWPPAISAWPGGMRQSLLLLLFPLWLGSVVVGVRRLAGRPHRARRSSWRVGAGLVRADDLAHRRPRALPRGLAASWPTRWSSPPRSSAGRSRSRCGCRATCWNPCSSRSVRWPWRCCWSPWYVRRHGWGRARVVPRRCGRCRRCSSTRSCTSARPATC